ncbi:DNA cytosine methyltransferase [Streptomyces sp. NPDC056007]|uniref:DNA cytosine methyltransferase n=1 Tax=Streptomyces sp. NPDC056007 TaxID=3345678 RepID=UPI0035E35577
MAESGLCCRRLQERRRHRSNARWWIQKAWRGRSGPSRAKAAWKNLGVSGMGVANGYEEGERKKSQGRDLFGPGGPMLTVDQAAVIQGFPDNWKFTGGKTAQYRQVGNAFPPPVAHAVGKAIADVLYSARVRDARAKGERRDVLPGQSASAVPDSVDDRQRAGV